MWGEGYPSFHPAPCPSLPSLKSLNALCSRLSGRPVRTFHVVWADRMDAAQVLSVAKSPLQGPLWLHFNTLHRGFTNCFGKWQSAPSYKSSEVVKWLFKHLPSSVRKQASLNCLWGHVCHCFPAESRVWTINCGSKKDMSDLTPVQWFFATKTKRKNKASKDDLNILSSNQTFFFQHQHVD